MFTGLCSRRDFLKKSSLAALGLALPLPEKRETPFAIGRVTTTLIFIYKEPFLNGERVGKCYRDQLLNLLEEVRSDKGPRYNPRWYRIADGFVHTAYIQRIDFRPANEPLPSIPDGGLLGEVTVPYARTFFRGRNTSWQPLYRLYYESLHWIKDVCEKPDGTIWYRLFDPKNDGDYFVPAAALRPLALAEFSPTARDVPSKDKRIVVSIDEQTLTAFEGERVVLQTSISSGTIPLEDVQEGELTTETPKGFFRVMQKMPSRHMGNGRFTNDIGAYELPGVPWMIAFHNSGASLHGSYWHDNFGHRMSHGCVNMRNAEALWLFRWTDPVYEPTSWYVNGLGTLIQVI